MRIKVFIIPIKLYKSYLLKSKGLSLMGVLAPVFSVFFFVMMISLGFGTEFSIMESVLSTVIDLFHEKLNTKRKKFILRIVFCGSLFILGLVMVARVRLYVLYNNRNHSLNLCKYLIKNGLFVLNLIDDSVSGYPLLVSGLLQVIVVIWIYGELYNLNFIDI
jgi:solute carrier family 6 amino acid transporter-like protein 5/7/9/14